MDPVPVPVPVPVPGSVAARSTGSPRALHHVSTEILELIEKSIEGGGTSAETRASAPPRVVAREVAKVLGRLPIDGGIRSKARGGRRVAAAAIPRVVRVHLRANSTDGTTPDPLPVSVAVSSTPRRVVKHDVAVPSTREARETHPKRLLFVVAIVQIRIEPEPEPERGRSRGTRRGSVRAEMGRFRVHRARAPPSRARPRPRPRPRPRRVRVGSAGDGGDPATHALNLPTKIAHLHRERVETPRGRAGRRRAVAVARARSRSARVVQGGGGGEGG